MKPPVFTRDELVSWFLFSFSALYITSIINFGSGLTFSPELTQWACSPGEMPIFLVLQLPLLTLTLIFLLLKTWLNRKSMLQLSIAEEFAPDFTSATPQIVFTILAAVGFLIWWFFLTRGYFFWDDHEHIPWVRYLSNPLAVFLDGSSPGRTFRPITWLFYWCEYRLCGIRSASGYYAASMIIHFLSGIMIYILGRSMINRRDIPLVAALIFFFLPVATRNCLFIASQDGVLEMLLCLNSIYLFNLYLVKKKIAYHILSVFSFLLAIMSKEQVIVFPLLIIVFDLFWGTVRSRRRRIIEYSPYWLIAIVFVIYRTLVMRGLGHISDKASLFRSLMLNPVLRIPRALFLFDEVISGPCPVLPIWRSVLLSAIICILLANSFKKSFIRINKLLLFSLAWIGIFSLPVIFFNPWAVHIYPQAFGFSFVLASLFDESRGRLLRCSQYFLFAILIGLFAMRSYEVMMDEAQDYDLVRGPLYRQTINTISDFVRSNYAYVEDGTVFIFVMEDPRMWRFVNDRYIKTVLGKAYYSDLFLPSALPDQGSYRRSNLCVQQVMIPMKLERYIWLNPHDPLSGRMDDDREGTVDSLYTMSPRRAKEKGLRHPPLSAFNYPSERYGGIVCGFFQPAIEPLGALMENDWNKKVLYMGADFKIEIKYDPAKGIYHVPSSWLG